MGKPQSSADWHAEDAARAGVTNPDNIFWVANCYTSTCYISNDRQWILTKKYGGNSDWEPFNVSGSTNQNAVNKRTEDSMKLWNIAVLRTPSANEQQDGKSTELVAQTDKAIVAPSQEVALILFGAKNAEQLKAVEPARDFLTVSIREGV